MGFFMNHHLARTPKPGRTPAAKMAAGLSAIASATADILPPESKPLSRISCISRLKLPAFFSVFFAVQTPRFRFLVSAFQPLCLCASVVDFPRPLSRVSRISRLIFPVSAFSLLLFPALVPANPTGGTVSQGKATFHTTDSQLTINTSANTLINWSSFNIGAGETTTFVQPSASSVVWNQINGGNPSQILGTLNANGYVILQNQSGFVVGGSAAINTHGLVMTTAPTPAPNLSSGGAWSFNAPPPSAGIINYGQINIAGGGSAFLIANDIVNNGTISAPGGKIGLYAGKQVLISTGPDGRQLSARVTLPRGSVDNEGRLIADGGSIMAQAQTVNQNGLVEANSVQNVNGVIELVASDNLSLGAGSDIEAHGDNRAATTRASSGGSVTIKSGNTFSDQAGSSINISGGTRGGNGGQVEISAPQMKAIQSRVNGSAAAGYTEGLLTIDPTDITLDADYATSLANQTASITLKTDGDIDITALLTLTDPGSSATFSLIAGNNITFDGGSSIAGIAAGKNWNVTLKAGTGFAPTASQPTPPPVSDGVYLNNGAYLQTQNGNLNVWAANEVIIQAASRDSFGNLTTPSGAMRTLAGGNINVMAEYGNVNAGDDINGYNFGLITTAYPYYYSVNSANLGGISTAAGGNVTITAGGNVISYLPTQNDYNNVYISSTYDGGTGAFGPEPGNVTITAGGTVVGNYVLANGVGTIQAGGNLGVPVTDAGAEGFALSLVKGSWNVYAPNIYLDDVMNPNGVFNDITSTSTGRNGTGIPPAAGAHVFNYDPQASLLLDAANAVEITGASVPLVPISEKTSAGYGSTPIPVLLPPSLTIVAGAGGITLDANVILYPSSDGNVSITTLNGGNFGSRQNPNDPYDVNIYSLQMSDSGQNKWSPTGSTESTEIFGLGDHAATPPELNNPNPVVVDISGDMNDINLYTTKETKLTVAGNMFNASFVGENLHPGDVTTVNVAGSISFSPIYTPLLNLASPITSIASQLPNSGYSSYSSWDSIFSLLVDDTPGDPNSAAIPIPPNEVNNTSDLKNLAAGDLLFTSATIPLPDNPCFIYNFATRQLGFAYQMPSAVRSALEGNLKIIQLDPNNPGVPLTAKGQASLGQNPNDTYFVTKTVSFVPASTIETLNQDSLSSVKNKDSLPTGFQIGGPGQFNVNAGSMNLGASGGVVSWGAGNGSQVPGNGVNFANLAPVTGANGASVAINVAGNLDMLTSTIATIGGGNLTVNSAGGEVDLGLPEFSFTPTAGIAYGIYTSGLGNVNVTAYGDINVDTARIAAFNGGNVTVESLDGDVNAGNGASFELSVPVYYPGLPALEGTKAIGTITTGGINVRPYGSGIMALLPTADYQIPGGSGLPGNISVLTPKGNIVSTLGGISQFTVNSDAGPGPTVTLVAGTPGVTATSAQGNINLGQGGALGGAVNVKATGNITGLIVSRQDTTVTANQNINVTVLSGGKATVNAGGNLSGTLIAVNGIDASGGDITATMLSDSVSDNGGSSQSTLGTATASAAADSAAGTANAQNQQQVATNDQSGDDKKKKPLPQVRRVKRVTVL